MKRAIALGFFDGVHRGHGQLLARCSQVAAERGLEAAALTFDRHPASLFAGNSPELLTTPAERGALMRRLYGIERVLTLHFDAAMCHMPWERFLDDVLIGQYQASYLVCGHDFRFGAEGAGTASMLREAAQARNLQCDIVPAFRIEDIVVSSTYIRKLLEAGDADRAREFLGHPHTLTGTVVAGAGLGRKLGFPTANLAVMPELLRPYPGVYACRARTRQGEFLAVTNIGTRPTLGGGQLTVEPWLLDFDGDLYGQRLTVELWHRLRGERRFDSLAELQAEVQKNARETRAFFAQMT